MVDMVQVELECFSRHKDIIQGGKKTVDAEKHIPACFGLVVGV